jgi:hypothetical protein
MLALLPSSGNVFYAGRYLGNIDGVVYEMHLQYPYGPAFDTIHFE